MKEKKMFYSYGSFRVPSYKGGKKILYLDTIAFLDTTYRQPILTTLWHRNIFVKSVISDTFRGVWMCLASCLSELHDKPRRKD